MTNFVGGPNFLGMKTPTKSAVTVGKSVVLAGDYADLVEASEDLRLSIFEVIDARGAGADPIYTIAIRYLSGILDGASVREVFASDLCVVGES